MSVRTSGQIEKGSRQFQYLLRLGDDRLVLGHRLSEWCGHAPILEEDIALANIALDLIGQATLLLGHAGKLEGEGRDADTLAYLRDAIEFRNVLLVELPKGDFAVTIVRQLFFGVFGLLQSEALQRSNDRDLAGIAAKAAKEVRYHVRHSADWVLKLGGGTDESRERTQRAVDDLWRYTGELFLADDVDRAAAAAGVGVDPSTLESRWHSHVEDVLARAGLTIPETLYMQRGGREGRHTEHLGHMLAEMQIVARSHPGASW
ncbi:MAG: phenylacetate-CoA oxygenase subunit PaaI [Bacteroidetes bacterium 13_1_20CM_4_60_6]|nr:MAG: phenylacetate-CoA oxygenase subunit PaaI [Bacteroidetes bacterium 13_1_20CM_4_60_6]